MKSGKYAYKLHTLILLLNKNNPLIDNEQRYVDNIKSSEIVLIIRISYANNIQLTVQLTH